MYAQPPSTTGAHRGSAASLVGASENENEQVETMSVNQTEVRGMVEKEIELLRQRRAALEKAGLKVDQLEESLTQGLADTTAEDARQEFLKAELKKSTARTTAAYEALYEQGAGLLDAMMGVIGKNSDEAKILQRTRSAIRRPGSPPEEVAIPVEPRPVA